MRVPSKCFGSSRVSVRVQARFLVKEISKFVSFLAIHKIVVYQLVWPIEETCEDTSVGKAKASRAAGLRYQDFKYR